VTAIGQSQQRIILTPETTCIRRNWIWFLAVGIVQILAGTLAVGFALRETLASTVTLGVLLLIAGGAQLVTALLARDWDAFYLFLLLALLYAVAGCVTLVHPILAGEGLGLMLAPLFLLVGLFRITVALIDNFRFWRWILFNGVVAVLVGLALWRHWPESGYWVIGVLVGIEFIVNGVSWSAMAAGMRCRLALSAGD
jgi:uncharacterized membrane protein HdeD (DUF308 family)